MTTALATACTHCVNAISTTKRAHGSGAWSHNDSAVSSRYWRLDTGVLECSIDREGSFMHPEFSAEAEALAARMPSPVLTVLRTTGWKLRLKKEQREGWSGSLPFYFFWCSECGHFSKDYPHGFVARQYLTCSHCGVHHVFVPTWASIAEAWHDFNALRRSARGPRS